MKLDNLEKLYIHELKDLHSVETQVLEEFQRMKGLARNKCLVGMLEDRIQESQIQMKRIEKILENYSFTANGHRCKGIDGIIKESKEALDCTESPEVRDAAMISMLNRIEHYELAGYGTARAYAEQLHKYDEADLLVESLSAVSRADHQLSTLAWRTVNSLASEATH